MAVKHYLFLHGALGSSKIFDTLPPYFDSSVRLHFLNFEGHGGTSMPNRPFRMENFCENIQKYLKAHSLENIPVFGYSMGGYAALLAALKYPGKISRVFTLGTKFFWTEEFAQKQVRHLNEDNLRQKAPQMVEDLKSHHGDPAWTEVLRKTAELLTRLGKGDLLPPAVLKDIPIPVRVGVGDKDRMVSLEDSMGAFRNLPLGELCVLPSTTHPFEEVSLLRLLPLIKDFFEI